MYNGLFAIVNSCKWVGSGRWIQFFDGSDWVGSKNLDPCPTLTHPSCTLHTDIFLYVFVMAIVNLFENISLKFAGYGGSVIANVIYRARIFSVALAFTTTVSSSETGNV